MDDVQKNNIELYKAIEQMKADMRERNIAIEERDDKID